MSRRPKPSPANTKKVGEEDAKEFKKSFVHHIHLDLVPDSLRGLEQVHLNFVRRLSLHEEPIDEISSLLATTIVGALHGNQTIGKLSMNWLLFGLTEKFHDFMMRIIPSMPNLEVVESVSVVEWEWNEESLFDPDPLLWHTAMDDERVLLLLDAVKESSMLRRIKCDSWGDVSPGLILAIDYECGLNRIGFMHLCKANDTSIPVALWPSNLANVRHVSTVFKLICEKNENF